MREMKDSGVEWIGEIPRDWDAGSFGNIIIQNDGGVWGADPNGYSDSIVLRSTEQTIDGCWSIEEPAKRDLSDIKTPEYYRCRKDDLLITKSSGSDLHIGKTTIVDEQVESLNCYYSNFIQRVRLQTIYSAKYYWYVLNSDIARSQFSFLSFSTSGLGNINSKTVKKMYVPFPPTLTQHYIAAYLDAQCARIDRTIARQQEVIERLKEYKLAVITEAVTKGLNPNVPMKDSGIEWIGEIPEGWEILKAARLIEQTQNGLTRRDLSESKGQIVLKLKNITNDGRLDYTECNRIELSDNEQEKYALSVDDFLFVRVNGSQSLVGKCAIFCGYDEVVAFNDHIIRVQLSDICNKQFIHWYLQSESGKREVELHINTAAGQFTISGVGLRNIRITFPPLNEQREICQYLAKASISIDNMLAKKQKIIDKLTEYKKSLIYEVVTGKREV